ncbi:IS110 family transposase [Streptomyces sp. CB02130]|uniref:IS110 family transposase n=1 Tax=Streptomyces sp. CB02130 TaxID=1703934 RepID=UPI000ABFCF94
MIDTGDIDVYPGLDVGKGEHHATAVTPVGKKAFDKRLPNTEPKLRELFAKLQAKHGTVLVVVDSVTGSQSPCASGTSIISVTAHSQPVRDLDPAGRQLFTKLRSEPQPKSSGKANTAQWE